MAATRAVVPTGPKTVSGLGVKDMAHLRRDDVVEVGDVVAVEMGQEHRLERRRPREGTAAARIETPAAGVEQEVAHRGADQRGRPGPVGRRDRTPAPQDHQLHVDHSPDSLPVLVLAESMTKD